jgi:hypothetical protein
VEIYRISTYVGCIRKFDPTRLEPLPLRIAKGMKTQNYNKHPSLASFVCIIHVLTFKQLTTVQDGSHPRTGSHAAKEGEEELHEPSAP